MSQDRLILFDIDGTMLHCGSSARESLSRALSEIAGFPIGLQIGDVAGYTDLGIMYAALEKHDLLDGNPNNILENVKSRYLKILEYAYPERGDQYLYPGIPELLERLSDHEHITLGLLTGNLIEGARIKLAPFGIWDSFALSAFGSDSMDRNDLPGIAWRKGRAELQREFTPQQTLIIGDTDKDALCARVNNTHALIICRRAAWKTAINRQHPHAVLDSTEDIDGILNIIQNL